MAHRRTVLLSRSLAWSVMAYWPGTAGAATRQSPSAPARREHSPMANGAVSVGPNALFVPHTRVVILECSDPGGSSAQPADQYRATATRTRCRRTLSWCSPTAASRQGYTLYSLPNAVSASSATGYRCAIPPTSACSSWERTRTTSPSRSSSHSPSPSLRRGGHRRRRDGHRRTPTIADHCDHIAVCSGLASGRPPWPSPELGGACGLPSVGLLVGVRLVAAASCSGEHADDHARRASHAAAAAGRRPPDRDQPGGDQGGPHLPVRIGVQRNHRAGHPGGGGRLPGGQGMEGAGAGRHPLRHRLVLVAGQRPLRGPAAALRAPSPSPWSRSSSPGRSPWPRR